jgi:cystathionine beta-synthase
VVAEAARRDPATPAGELAGPPPRTVGPGETAAEALARVDGAHAVLLRDGRLAGLLTRAALTEACRRDLAATGSAS